MKTYTYTVYHIPGIKIGCTADFEKRMLDQGFTNWEILWQQEGDWDFGWTAGDKEIEFQKEYGLPVDTIHYQISRENRRSWTKEDSVKGGNIHKNTGHIQNIQKKGCVLGGKISGGKNFTKESNIRGGKKGGKKGGLVHGKRFHECPHCKKEGHGNAMLQWHFDNCKYKV